MNSPDSYDDDLALVLDTATLNELAVVEAKLTAPPGPVPTEELPPNPDYQLFDLLDPTFDEIIPHLHGLDATVTRQEAAAANRLPKSPSFPPLITVSQAQGQSSSQVTLYGDDQGGSLSPEKLLLSPGSPTNSYDDDLAPALDTATLVRAKVKSMAPGPTSDPSSGPVPYEETELDAVIPIPEHHKRKAAATNRLPESPTLITDSQATVCGDDRGGPSSPAKLLGKRDATDFVDMDEEGSTGMGTQRRKSKRGRRQTKTAQQRQSKCGRRQTKTTHSHSCKVPRPPPRRTPSSADPDSDDPINFLRF